MPLGQDSHFLTKSDLVVGTHLEFNQSVPMLSRDYPVKLLCIPDIHCLIKEPRNRNGVLISRTNQLIDELCYIMVQNNITGVVFLGDIADQGASSSNLNDESTRLSKIIKLVRCADGNAFSVFGNHERTYHANNMFYTIASIDSEDLRHEVFGFNKPELLYPYIRTPACIDYGICKIYLMHFRKAPKDKLYRVNDVNYHTVCLYHDDLISFESKMELYHHKLGNGIDIHNTNIFDNVDWAILGHIHTPLETFNLLNERKTVVDCVGSFIGRNIAEKHERLKLPVICIDENGLSREYLNFNIGAFEGTVNETVVADERKKRQMSALLKKETIDTFNVADYGDLMGNIKNAEIRSIIEKSVHPLVPKSLDMYSKWYNKKYKTSTDVESRMGENEDIFDGIDDETLII